MCPALVTACLETLEEIELQGAEIFKQAGGESLTLIPCLNDHEQWFSVISRWCESILCNLVPQYSRRSGKYSF